jgi:hypothetical protein
VAAACACDRQPPGWRSRRSTSPLASTPIDSLEQRELL